MAKLLDGFATYVDLFTKNSLPPDPMEFILTEEPKLLS